MNTLMGQDPAHFLDAVHYTPDGIRRFGRVYARELREVIEGEPQETGLVARP